MQIRIFSVAVAGLFAAIFGASASAQGMPGMDHGSMGHGEHGAMAASAAGQPGEPARATRTVSITALDTMRFDPAMLAVKAGETVRFVVTNAGKLQHEFTIGDAQTQLAHEQMMQSMPGMRHEEPNSVSLAPGEAKTLVWQFAESGSVEIGCHEPGHYPAGMRAVVEVTQGEGTSGTPQGSGHGMHGMDARHGK